MYNLVGKTVLLTGGATGIGRRIATRLAEEGCDIGLLDINEAQARETAELVTKAGGRAAVFVGDVGDYGQVAATVQRFRDTHGHIDILINNAGVIHVSTVADTALEDWRALFRSNLAYPLDTLLRLFEAVPSIRAIKDWCNDAMLHERHIRTFQSLPRPVTVLTTHSSWLMSSLVMGCGGLLSGAGSVIADLQVALWQAVQANDLRRARAINDRIYPMAQAFYAAPFLDMHNRMKEALVLLGRLPRAVVRPPLVKIQAEEIERIRAALVEARLLDQGAGRQAA